MAEEKKPGVFGRKGKMTLLGSLTSFGIILLTKYADMDLETAQTLIAAVVALCIFYIQGTAKEDAARNYSGEPQAEVKTSISWTGATDEINEELKKPYTESNATKKEGE